MRRASLTRERALALGQVVNDRRNEIGMSLRQLAAKTGLDSATVLRLERGDILTPQADTLTSIAEILDLPVSDLFTVAGWVPPKELPTLRPYLRTKYGQLPEDAVGEMEAFFGRLAKKHGMRGPNDGEDED